MPTLDEINKRVDRELLLAARLERSVSSLYKQNYKQLVRMYTSLMSKYWENGKFDMISYNRDKAYSQLFNQQITELNAAIASFAASAGVYTTNELTNTLVFSYARVMKDTFADAKRIVPLELRTPDSVKEAVSRNFQDGKKFSDRIWGSTQDMERKLRETLDNSILNGESIDATSKEFARVTGQAFNNSKRVIRTETIATYTRASLDGYKALGIEKVKVLESQYGVCTSVCSQHNGEIIKVNAAVIGTNVPPFHPNCRGSIAPVIEK